MRFCILAILFIGFNKLSAQTCCTAGAPVSSFYGIQNGSNNSWVVNLSYEYKGINLLIDQNDRLVNDPRTRSGQSLSTKIDYILNKKWSFSAIVPFIYQSRKTISASENSLGIGDLLLVTQYEILNKSNYRLSFSGGIKLPIGQLNHRNDAALLLSPDMQSGSGSFDWVARINLIKEHFLIPFLTPAIEFSYRENGVNDSFGSTQNFSGRRFGFGDVFVGLVSINYQWTTSHGIITPDINFRFRKSNRNIEQNTEAPNSGGNWWSVPFGLSFQPDLQKSIRLYAEIPLSQNINGLQITTNFTAGIQFRYIINKKN